MSQKDKYFFNINKTDKGIFRELGEGIITRIFPGDQAMVSVVKIDPNSTGKIHSHPQEQWSLMVDGSATRIQGNEKISVRKGDICCTP